MYLLNQQKISRLWPLLLFTKTRNKMNKFKIVLLCAVFVSGGTAMAQSNNQSTNDGTSHYGSNDNNSRKAEALAATGPSRAAKKRRGSGSAGSKSPGSKSGYTVLPQHPNARSGMQRVKRKKSGAQAGNGGRQTGKTKTRRKGKGKYAGCDAYM